MSKLAYVSSTGERIELDGDFIYSGGALGIRGHEWSYNVGHKNLKGISRGARKVQIEINSVSPKHVDEMRRAFDADMCAENPGRLIAYDKWFQRAFIVAMNPSELYDDWLKASLDVVLLDGVWRCEHKKSFSPFTHIAKESPFLDYPHDYPYDYSRTDSGSSLEIKSPSCDMKLVIYGSATNPYITIAGNIYEIRASIDVGTYVEISTIDRTIIHTTLHARKNLFSAGIRDKGEGSGKYIFQRLPAGIHNVSWNKSFGFDLIWYEEEGEPPWSDR